MKLLRSKIFGVAIGLLAIYLLTACATTAQAKHIGYIEELIGYDTAHEPLLLQVLHEPEDIYYEETSPIVRLIAHAGAAVEGFPDSNSLEAMQNAAALGFRYIELDLIQTSDGVTVGNHNWYNVNNRIPGVPNEIMTHEEFMNHKIFGRFTPVDLDLIIEFLDQTPDVYIITDTKATDYAALYDIAHRFPKYMERFIPQSYAFEDVQRLRNLGFEKIMLTVYMMHYSEQNPVELYEFIQENELYALVIPDELATSEFIKNINTDEIKIFVHTINSISRVEELAALGFQGIFTAHIAYDAYSENGITRRSTPIQQELERIKQNIRELNQEQQQLISNALIYQLNNSVYIHNGESLPLWDEHLVTHPFVSPVSGRTYVTRVNFDRYSEGHVWTAGQLKITAHEKTHWFYAADYDVFNYRDMMFMCVQKLAEVFLFNVRLHNDLVIFAPYGSDFDKLMEIGASLFGQNL